MRTYNLNKEDLEEVADQVKAIVLVDLVNKKILPLEVAENYAMKHTLILRAKSFFRTVTNRWKKAKSNEFYSWVIVGNDAIDDTDNSNTKNGILTNMLNDILTEQNDTKKIY